MNLSSIFGSSGFHRENGSGTAIHEKLYRIVKSKAGAGVGIVFFILLLYLAVTLFTIYNLLASL